MKKDRNIEKSNGFTFNRHGNRTYGWSRYHACSVRSGQSPQGVRSSCMLTLQTVFNGMRASLVLCWRSVLWTRSNRAITSSVISTRNDHRLFKNELRSQKGYEISVEIAWGFGLFAPLHGITRCIRWSWKVSSSMFRKIQPWLDGFDLLAQR